MVGVGERWVVEMGGRKGWELGSELGLELG